MFPAETDDDQPAECKGVVALAVAEQVTTLDTDVLVWIVGSEAEAANIAALPTRSALTAAQEGREVLTDAELSGALSFSSPLSLPYVLEKLVPQLKAAVAGTAPNAVVSP